MMTKPYAFVAAIATALTLAASSASGAFLVLLKVGDIPGDSNVDSYRNWSDALSYSMSVSNPGWVYEPAAAVSFSDMYVTKYVDKASPYYLGAVVLGMHFPAAQVDVVQLIDERPVLVANWQFEDAVISSYNTALDGANAIELVALDFRKVTYMYYPMASDGRPLPPTGFAYDRLTFQYDWIGPWPPTEFQLLTEFRSSSTPEPAMAVLAAVGLTWAAAWRRPRWRTSPAANPSWSRQGASRHEC